MTSKNKRIFAVEDSKTHAKITAADGIMHYHLPADLARCGDKMDGAINYVNMTRNLLCRVMPRCGENYVRRGI